MKLSTVIRQARNGELRGMSLKDKTDEVVVDYINMAIIELHKRFTLHVDEAIITLRTAKTVYSLSSTDTDVTVNNLPMVDGTVMQIIEAYDEKGSIPINDDTNPFSIYTVAYNKVQVPITNIGSYISIIFRVNPELVVFVDAGQGTATEAEIDLPDSLLEPMLHYIGYRAHGSVDGNISAENNTHLMRFKASCNDIEAMGLLPSDVIARNVWSKGFI